MLIIQESGLEKDVGGGYYTYWNGNEKTKYEIGYFGLGGCWADAYDTGSNMYTWSTAGSGGIAGRGGEIYYENADNINAFNGNRITDKDFNYENLYYEFDKNGGKTSEIVETVIMNTEEGKKILPAKIFAQDGIRRAVYDHDVYMSAEQKQYFGLGDDLSGLEVKGKSKRESVKLVKVLEEMNIKHSQQGIGSRSRIYRT